MTTSPTLEEDQAELEEGIKQDISTSPTLEAFQSELEEIERAISAVHAQIRPLRDELYNLITAREELMSQEVNIRIAAGQVSLKWMIDNPEAGVEIHRHFDNVIREMGLKQRGYLTETNQRGVELMMTKGSEDSFETTKQSLLKLIPLSRPLKDGLCYFGIFEHTLAEGGIYSFHASPSMDRFVLRKTTYGLKRDIKGWNNLDEALRYIQDNHYYESLNPDDDQDEDDYDDFGY